MNGGGTRELRSLQYLREKKKRKDWGKYAGNEFDLVKAVVNDQRRVSL
ncbi:hypothetical protein HID58_092035 [Brassica napus]|uniref:Uncharacterized protein n=1 Tax=Brassica napus TaxID=3708 RepID=A0ABQ7WZY2_BRANA|nr:hypothetical protein HID58_092035 [Brassica napus]